MHQKEFGSEFDQFEEEFFDQQKSVHENDSGMLQIRNANQQYSMNEPIVNFELGDPR